jgi:hypothetical protein
VIGCGGHELGFLRRRVDGVRAALPAGAALTQQPVHRGLRAQVAALIQQDRVRLGDGLVREPRRVQPGQDAFFLLGRQFRGMTEPLPSRSLRGWFRVALPVQRGPALPEDPAGGSDADCLFHRGQVIADDLIQFPPESALREMSSRGIIHSSEFPWLP